MIIRRTEVQNNIKNNNDSLIPEGNYKAIVTKLIDAGTQDAFSSRSKSLFIGLTLLDGSNSELGQIYNLYTADLGWNSKLRRHIESWRGRVFTNSELSSFEMDAIVGKSLKVNVVHQTSRAGRTYAVAEDFKDHRLDGHILAEYETDIVELNEEFDFELFEKLPPNVQYFIRNSKEFNGLQKKEQSPPDEVDTEDLPF